MPMRENKGFFSFAFDSATVEYGVRPGLKPNSKTFCSHFVVQTAKLEALLGVLGIRDNWQNNFRDKG